MAERPEFTHQRERHGLVGPFSGRAARRGLRRRIVAAVVLIGVTTPLGTGRGDAAHRPAGHRVRHRPGARGRAPAGRPRARALGPARRRHDVPARRPRRQPDPPGRPARQGRLAQLLGHAGARPASRRLPILRDLSERYRDAGPRGRRGGRPGDLAGGRPGLRRPYQLAYTIGFDASGRHLPPRTRATPCRPRSSSAPTGSSATSCTRRSPRPRRTARAGDPAGAGRQPGASRHGCRAAAAAEPAVSRPALAATAGMKSHPRRSRSSRPRRSAGPGGGSPAVPARRRRRRSAPSFRYRGLHRRRRTLVREVRRSTPRLRPRASPRAPRRRVLSGSARCSPGYVAYTIDAPSARPIRVARDRRPVRHLPRRARRSASTVNTCRSGRRARRRRSWSSLNTQRSSRLGDHRGPYDLVPAGRPRSAWVSVRRRSARRREPSGTDRRDDELHRSPRNPDVRRPRRRSLARSTSCMRSSIRRARRPGRPIPTHGDRCRPRSSATSRPDPRDVDVELVRGDHRPARSAVQVARCIRPGWSAKSSRWASSPGRVVHAHTPCPFGTGRGRTPHPTVEHPRPERRPALGTHQHGPPRDASPG